MGVKGLLGFLRSRAPDCFRKSSLDEFRGKTVVLDSLFLMHTSALSKNGNGRWEKGFASQVNRMVRKGVTPVYCTDGVLPNPLKAREAEQRRRSIQKREEQGKSSFRVNAGEIDILETLCASFGVRHIQCEGEADGLMSALVREGLCAAAVSDDSDLLAHGCPTVVRSWHGDAVEVVDVDRARAQLGWCKPTAATRRHSHAPARVRNEPKRPFGV